jgi:hypothetical protein
MHPLDVSLETGGGIGILIIILIVLAIIYFARRV